MEIVRFNTAQVSKKHPGYVPSAEEMKIMSYGPTRWFESRTDRGLVLNDDGTFKSWTDRAKGVRYRPVVRDVPPTISTPDDAKRRVNFTGAIGQALIAEDASIAFPNLQTYSVAMVTRQTNGANTFGGAAFGNTAFEPDLMMGWMGANGSFNYFMDGMGTALNNGVAQNDALWHVNVVSIDVTQGTAANRGQLRRDGTVLTDNTGVPISMGDSYGSRQLLIGGAGFYNGLQGSGFPFKGAVAALIVIPNLALHLPANIDALLLVENYLSGIRASMV